MIFRTVFFCNEVVLPLDLETHTEILPDTGVGAGISKLAGVGASAPFAPLLSLLAPPELMVIAPKTHFETLTQTTLGRLHMRGNLKFVTPKYTFLKPIIYMFFIFQAPNFNSFL